MLCGKKALPVTLSVTILGIITAVLANCSSDSNHAPSGYPASNVPPNYQAAAPLGSDDRPTQDLAWLNGFIDPALTTYYGELRAPNRNASADPSAPKFFVQNFMLTLSKQIVSGQNLAAGAYPQPYAQPTYGLQPGQPGYVPPANGSITAVYMAFNSSGPAGEIHFSRFVDYEASSTSYGWPTGTTRMFALKSHPVQIPALSGQPLLLAPTQGWGDDEDSDSANSSQTSSSFAIELRIALMQGNQIDPARSRVSILGCGSAWSCSDSAPFGVKVRLTPVRR